MHFFHIGKFGPLKFDFPLLIHLYLLAGLYNPTSGKIFYKNQNLSQIDQYEYAKRIGFIFQNPENMIFKRTIKDEILPGFVDHCQPFL